MSEVAIISDSPVVRVGLRVFIEERGDIVVWEGPPSWEAVQGLSGRGHDAALLDIGVTSVEACVFLCTSFLTAPDLPPLVGVECRRDPVRFVPLIAACRAFPTWVDGNCAQSQAASAAASSREKHVSEGTVYQCPAHDNAVPGTDDQPFSLTDEQILRLLAKGLRDREIAGQLSFGCSTIKHRVEAMERTLSLHTRFQLGLWAGMHGIAKL